mmetsp:Transcript_30466/g.79094  ORF Transcript_30466/g.79094 Transcript_30466/m.79094 type:complete len:228 (-) Transcript_30466:65-748(-)
MLRSHRHVRRRLVRAAAERQPAGCRCLESRLPEEGEGVRRRDAHEALLRDWLLAGRRKTPERRDDQRQHALNPLGAARQPLSACKFELRRCRTSRQGTTCSACALAELGRRGALDGCDSFLGGSRRRRLGRPSCASRDSSFHLIRKLLGNDGPHWPSCPPRLHIIESCDPGAGIRICLDSTVAMFPLHNLAHGKCTPSPPARPILGGRWRRFQCSLERAAFCAELLD